MSKLPDEIERCILCDEPTGRARKGDDSMYIEYVGPLCESCSDTLEPVRIYITKLTADVALRDRAMQLMAGDLCNCSGCPTPDMCSVRYDTYYRPLHAGGR